MKVLFLWILIMIQGLFLWCPASRAGSISLAEKLLSTARADVYPVCPNTTRVTISLDVVLRQIVDLKEKEQIFTTNVWIRLKWKDCHFQWNVSAYENTSRILVPYHSVWTPDLTLYDSSAEEEMMPGREDYHIQISSTGTIRYNFPTVLKSICRLQVTYFPFDVQICVLQFGSWSYSLAELDIVPVGYGGNDYDYLKHYEPNTEWDVTKTEVYRNVIRYEMDGREYVDVEYRYTLQRRSTFYLVTMLFPCTLFTLVGLTGFLLPSESGEKVSLQITVLLSLVVFLLLMAEFLPPSAENIPILGTYFAVSMLLVTFSLFLSSIVLNIHFLGETDRPVPQCLDRLLKKKSHSCFCKYNSAKQKYTINNINGEVINMAVNGNPYPQTEDTSGISSEHCEHVLDKKGSETDNRAKWRRLAVWLDRIFLVLYIVITVAVIVSFLIEMRPHELPVVWTPSTPPVT